MNFIEERFGDPTVPIDFLLVATVDTSSQAHVLTRALGGQKINWRTLYQVGPAGQDVWHILVDRQRTLDAAGVILQFMFKGRRLVCGCCGWDLDGYRGPCPGCTEIPQAANS